MGDALVNCAACQLDHEWAAPWTLDTCPARAREPMLVVDRVAMLMSGLRKCTTPQQFEALLRAHIEGARAEGPAP